MDDSSLAFRRGNKTHIFLVVVGVFKHIIINKTLPMGLEMGTAAHSALGLGGARARGRGRRRSGSGTGTAALGLGDGDGDALDARARRRSGSGTGTTRRLGSWTGAAAWRRNCVSSGGTS